MRIAQVEIQNFRGIRELMWRPGPGINCLIGPGDSTKTTVLDAIELCLNPRSHTLADDCDFHDLDVTKTVQITVTLVDIPKDFVAEDRYGRYLRGWLNSESKLEDEPREGLEYALSIVVSFDRSLEITWSLFNNRIASNDAADPPMLRYKDARLCATTRLGPYAERHLAWGRTSVLARIGDDAGDALSLQLAEAARAARASFKAAGTGVFQKTVDRAKDIGRQFGVQPRGVYNAELDVEGVSITSGGIALHDDRLPLRRLGCGSARLLVSALQHEAGATHVALIDEVEHGLEPHRLARLLKFLKMPKATGGAQPQIFMTSHSPVVIRELDAKNLYSVRSNAGRTQVSAVLGTTHDPNLVQGHIRRSPEAFLARRIVVGEGRTEQGLLRGLDTWWSANGLESFALRGAIAVDGGGNNAALQIGAHLRDLGYDVLIVLDSDQQPDQAILQEARDSGALVEQWEGGVCTEERLFLDLPWALVGRVVREARRDTVNEDSAKATLNNHLRGAGLAALTDLLLPLQTDSVKFRQVLGRSAHDDHWFKSLSCGERIAEIVGPALTNADPNSPFLKTKFAEGVRRIRAWIDA